MQANEQVSLHPSRFLHPNMQRYTRDLGGSTPVGTDLIRTMPGQAQEPGLLQAITGILALMGGGDDAAARAKGKAEAESGKHLKNADEEERRRRRQREIEMEEALKRAREREIQDTQDNDPYVPDAVNRMIDRIWEKIS